MAENSKWRNRIVETVQMRVGDLAVNRYNPKVHPASQETRVEAVLEKFGIVDSLIAWKSERNNGQWTIFDGHLRQKLDPDQVWTVHKTSLRDEEVDELVFYFDPLAGMSLHDEAKMTALMQDLGNVDGVLGEMLEELQGIVPEIDYDELWQGMPEFEQEDQTAFQVIKVNFATREDVATFTELVGQKITDRTRSIWYPEAEQFSLTDKVYRDES